MRTHQSNTARGAAALHHFMNAMIREHAFWGAKPYQRNIQHDEGNILYLSCGLEDVFDTNPASLSLLMSSVKGSYDSIVCFWPNPLVVNSTDVLFVETLVSGEYLKMFTGERDIALGGFFNRPSRLRYLLSAYLEDINGRPFFPDVVGIELWKIIYQSGEVSTLWKIWQDLFDHEIKPEMLLRDPTCFG